MVAILTSLSFLMVRLYCLCVYVSHSLSLLAAANDSSLATRASAGETRIVRIVICLLSVEFLRNCTPNEAEGTRVTASKGIFLTLILRNVEYSLLDQDLRFRMTLFFLSHSISLRDYRREEGNWKAEEISFLFLFSCKRRRERKENVSVRVSACTPSLVARRSRSTSGAKKRERK